LSERRCSTRPEAIGADVAGTDQALLGLRVHSSDASDFLAPIASSKRSVVARSALMLFSSCPTERNPLVARGSFSIARSVLFWRHSEIAFQGMRFLRLMVRAY
jgi:hypothetical protein